MNLDEAKFILANSERHELRDQSFGYMEVTWTKLGIQIASGYFGDRKEVFVNDDLFEGDAAVILSQCGTLADVERNDETGLDKLISGQTMPELTTEGVKEELTRRNVFDE